jgi:hypothetical protein
MHFRLVSIACIASVSVALASDFIVRALQERKIKMGLVSNADLRMSR